MLVIVPSVSLNDSGVRLLAARSYSLPLALVICRYVICNVNILVTHNAHRLGVQPILNDVDRVDTPSLQHSPSYTTWCRMNWVLADVHRTHACEYSCVRSLHDVRKVVQVQWENVVAPWMRMR